MARSDLTSGSPRLCSCLCLWLVASTLPEVCAATGAIAQAARGQVIINPRSIKLPIVDAADNRFVRLSTVQGVSQIKADHIVQDEEGFMWFGTRYGLVRYDGYILKVFVRQSGNPTSLDAVSIEALFKDRDGALWVASAQSVNKYDRTTEVFERYPIPSANYITQDTAGILWLTSRSGLYSLDPTSKRLRHYSHDPKDSSSLSNNLSYCGEDRSGAFWVAGNGYLDEFDRKAGKVVRRIRMSGASHEFRFHEDRTGAFWIYHSSPGYRQGCSLTAFQKRSASNENKFSENVERTSPYVP